MPADIPADVAYIGGVWAEGVLYGKLANHLPITMTNFLVRDSVCDPFSPAFEVLTPLQHNLVRNTLQDIPQQVIH